MGTKNLDRRLFLLSAAAGSELAARAAQPARPVAANRTYPLNRNWKFGGKTRPGVLETTFDDTAWETVTLPHANVRLPWHSFEEKDLSPTMRSFPATAGTRHAWLCW